MDVTVFKINYKDFTAEDFTHSPSEFKRYSLGKHVYLTEETMPLAEAVKKRLSFISRNDQFSFNSGESLHNRGVYCYNAETTQRESYYGRHNTPSEFYDGVNYNSFERDAAPPKDAPPVMRIMSSDMLSKKDSPSSNVSEHYEESMAMLSYALPIVEEKRQRSLNKDRVTKADNAALYLEKINRFGLTNDTVGFGNEHSPAKTSNFSTSVLKHLSPGHSSNVSVESIIGVEGLPICAFAETTKANDNWAGQSLLNFHSGIANKLGEDFYSSRVGVTVVDEITEEMVIELVREFCEYTKGNAWRLWGTIVNTIAVCVGNNAGTGGATHYNAAKTGLYMLKPGIKGKIKTKTDLYNIVEANDAAKAQDFTVDELVNEKTMPYWLSILHCVVQPDRYIIHDGCSRGNLMSIAQQFYKSSKGDFGVVNKSTIDLYATDIGTSQYLGYGNALEALKRDNAIKIGASVQELNTPQRLPAAVFLKPGLHENYDHKVFDDLQSIYRSDDQEKLSPHALKSSGVMCFSGTYDASTSRFSLSPNMHMVVPNPKYFNTKSLEKLRAAIKCILPNTRFVGRSMKFSVSEQDIKSPAFRIMFNSPEQSSTVKIDSNISTETAACVYDKASFGALFTTLALAGPLQTLGGNQEPGPSFYSRFCKGYEDILGGRKAHNWGNQVTTSEMKETLKALGLKRSGNKEELAARIAAHWGELYEKNNVRDRIAAVIPFDNLVIFKEEGRHSSWNASRNVISEQGMEQMRKYSGLGTVVTPNSEQVAKVMYSCNAFDDIKIMDRNGKAAPTATTIARLIIEFNEEFKMSIHDMQHLFSVYFFEHTASGSIFRKSHRDSLRTPENLFYEMITAGDGKDDYDWKGMEL